MLIRTATVMAMRRNTSDLPSSRQRPIRRWFDALEEETQNWPLFE
jgi:hypothetical protein